MIFDLILSSKIFDRLVIILQIGRIGNMILILVSSLCFASITFFPEWKIKIIANYTNPILCSILCIWFSKFVVWLLFYWCKIIVHFCYFCYEEVYIGIFYLKITNLFIFWYFWICLFDNSIFLFYEIKNNTIKNYIMGQ